MKIKVAEIFIPPDRQRKNFNQSKVAELAVSIQATGQINPIAVTKFDPVRYPDKPPHLTWTLVAGYRRLLAVALLKLPEIEATLKENLNDLQLKEIELDENLQREDLNWTDAVKAKAELADIRKQLYGSSITETAEHVGESRGTFWEDQRLAKAIIDHPELAESKTKSQAQNKLRLLKRREILTEKAAELTSAATKLDPSLANFSAKVKLGDCLEISKNWPSQAFHCVITDPPYGINLDVGETKKSNPHPTIYDDHNFDIMDLTARVAKEAFRILQDNTHAYFFFDIKSYDKVLAALRDAGFTVDPIPLIWVKSGSGQVNHPDSRFGSSYEACFFCRKGNRGLLKQGQSNVLKHDPVPPNKKIHPVEKPTSLIRQLIETSTAPNEIIVDFFGGSGSTAEAALQTGRNFLICEKDPAFFAGIIERLTNLTSSPTSSTSNNQSSEDEEWIEEYLDTKGK